jgi:hypothetical protein
VEADRDEPKENAASTRSSARFAVIERIWPPDGFLAAQFTASWTTPRPENSLKGILPHFRGL